jgi:hypothetical protein
MRKLVRSEVCRHTKQPEGYLQWHAWAEKKLKTHRQIKCPNCGLYAIWIKRAGGESRKGPQS